MNSWPCIVDIYRTKGITTVTPHDSYYIIISPMLRSLSAEIVDRNFHRQTSLN